MNSNSHMISHYFIVSWIMHTMHTINILEIVLVYVKNSLYLNV